MVNFFQAVWSAIEMLIDIVVNIINSLITLLTTIAGAVTVPTTLSLYVFPVLSASIIMVGALAVVKFIVGR